MVLSLMSKNKSKAGYLVELFRKYGVISGLMILPFFSYLFYYCPEIIELVVGKKWLQSVELFRIFLLYYCVKLVFYPSNGILTSFGRPDIKARVTLTTFLISLPILYYVSYNDLGITYYAMVFIFLSTLSDMVCSVLGFQVLKESILSFITSRFKYFWILILQFIMLYLLDKYFLFGSFWKSQIALLGTLLVIYFAIVTYSKPFLEALNLFIKNKQVNRVLAILILHKK